MNSWIAPKIGVQVPEIQQGSILQGGSANTAGGDAGHVTWEGHTIPYTIKRNPRAKRTTIKVNRDREVCVVSPPHGSVTHIHAFITQNAEWVYTHTIEASGPLRGNRTYEDGDFLPF